MRSRYQGRLLMAAMLSLSLGVPLGSFGPIAPRFPDLDPDPYPPDSPPPLSARDRLELDLYHAEEQLAAARTPGAKRKAMRKVASLRTMLDP